MITVTVERIVTLPEYQVFQQTVIVHGFDKLTPKAARAALEIAFGNSNEGRVWWNGYGYSVYAKTARKLAREERE